MVVRHLEVRRNLAGDVGQGGGGRAGGHRHRVEHRLLLAQHQLPQQSCNTDLFQRRSTSSLNRSNVHTVIAGPKLPGQFN